MTMKRALVTGGSGDLGKWCVCVMQTIESLSHCLTVSSKHIFSECGIKWQSSTEDTDLISGRATIVAVFNN
jgi:hypothetical protein